MSLAIDVDKVHEVLLPDGKWHEVADHSFEIDAYEYLRASEVKPSEGGTGVRLGGGQEKLVPAAGATWLERDSLGNRRCVFCPLTAIHAVTYATKRK